MLNASAKAILLLALTSLFASTAMAETQWEKHHPRRDQVNDRAQHLNHRIHREVKQGEMSRAEANQLHQDVHQVRQEERGMAQVNGGGITRVQQKALNQQENGISKQIGH